MCTFIEMDNKEISRVFNTSEEVVKALKENILKHRSIIKILKTWKISSMQKFVTVIEQICQELPEDVNKTLFLSDVVPNMISLETGTLIRDNLVDIAFMMCNIVPVYDLSAQEYELFLKEIYSKYIPAISQLRDSNYQNWHKLWIFLVRFCARKIHESMDLTNRLLRIVEYAFRNSSHEQRLKGYDCWKELIDNASLDHRHMCTPKQIKLLITPLKAKFSKQEVVICKRFDVFVHLLQKLQNQAVLCLPEFLEFCFGSMSDNKDTYRSGQTKTVPQIWAKSVNVLLSVLGHSHEQNVDCFSEDLHFNEPVINENNFQKYYKHIIHSVGECCSLLKDDTLDFKRDKVIKCMWSSLFNLAMSASEMDRIKYFTCIATVLDNYIKQSEETPYYEKLLVLIYTSLVTFDKDGIHDCIPLILKPLLVVLLTMDVGSENNINSLKQIISHSFTKVILEENKVKMVEVVLDSLCSLTIEDKNLPNFTKIWILLANELTTDFTTEKFIQFSKFEEFFMWPSQKMHHLDSPSKKQMVLHWMKLYRKMTVDSDIKKMEILKELEKNFKSNPLTSSNVTSLLSVISQFETKFSKEFVTKLLEIVSSILQLPNLQSEDEQKLSSLVMQYFEPSLDCFSSENIDEMIKVICICIDHILSIHAGFKLIDPFVTFFKNCPAILQQKFSSYLKTLLQELYNKENDASSYNSKEISKCLVLFTEGSKEKEEEKKTFIVPTGRSARIAHMGKNSPTSPHKPKKSTANLRLFGKDVETMSPLKMKGSQLNKTPVSKKKSVNIVSVQKTNVRSVNEENSSDFVPINSEVKLHVSKMSEHQKEVLKKRREDIPALYQDLSQSMSQDMFSSKSNSREATEQENAKLAKPLETPTPVITEKENPDTVNSEYDMFPETQKEMTESKEVIPETENDDKLDIETDKIVDIISKPQNSKFNDVPCTQENKIVRTISSDLFSTDHSSKPSGDNNTSLGSSKITEFDSKPSDSSRNTEPTTSKDVTDVNYSRKSLGSHKDDEDPAERKKRKELERLRMDIVGADKYFESPRRTREKKPIKSKDETSGKKAKGKKVSKTDTDNDLKSVEVVPDTNLIETPKTGNELNHVNINSDKITETVKLIDTPAPVKIDGNETNLTEKAETVLPDSEAKKPRKPKVDKKDVKTPIIENQTGKSKETTATKNNVKNVYEIVKQDDGNDDKLKISLKSISPIKDKEKSPLKTVIKIDFKNTENEELNSSSEDSTSESGKRGRGRPKGANKLHISRTAKIFQKLESPTKSSPRLAKQRQEKAKDEAKEEIGKLNDTETPKLDKSYKKNLSSKLTKQYYSVFETPKNKPVVKEQEDEQEVPINQNQKNDVPDIIEETQKTTSEIIREKRKMADEESEDIIESSQESFDEIVPLLNSSKKKQLRLSIDKACTSLENKDIEKAKDIVTESSFKSIENDAELIQRYVLELDGKIELITEESDLKESEAEINNANTTQDTTLTHDASQDSIPIDDTFSKVSLITEPTLTLDTKMDSGEMSPESLEPPKKPNFTESDLIRCQMDTMSVCGSKESMGTITDDENKEKWEPSISLNSVEDILATTQSNETVSSCPSTPQKSKSIPSSPVTADTPNRTNELLDNTVNISPITSRSNSEEEISEEVPVAEPIHALIEEELRRMGEGELGINEDEKELDQNEGGIAIKNKEEMSELERQEIVNDFYKDDTFEESNSSDEFEHADASSEAEMTPLETSDIQDPTEMEIIQHLPQQTDENEEPPIQNGQVSTTINISTRPFTSTIQERASKIQNLMHAIVHKPFMKRKGGSTSSPSALRIKKLMNNVGQKQTYPEVAETFNENDILTFSREIPSPLAVPRSSILKRKFSDSSDGEGISPCAKRKRVNFSDPCLTSKKIFIKDEYQPSLEAKRLFDVSSDKKSSDDNLKDIFDFPDDSPSSELSTETDSDMPETEPSLTVVNPMVLHRGKPVFPKLVECTDDVLLIVKRITSPMFVPALMNKLKGKNIKTIGDLAKLSESEVNRFPFKVPVVANVIKALETYHKKKGDGDNRLEEKTDSSKEEDRRNGEIEMPKLDVKLELKMLIKRAVREKVPTEELVQIILPHVDPTKLTCVIKQHCPTIAIDALDEKDYTSVLKKIIINSKGISEILKRTHVNFYNEEREHEFYDAIAEYVRYTVPLEKFFRGRSVEDLEVGIEESIKNKIFQKSDVIDHCLFPLLEGPKDIFPYLETLNMVQFNEVVINRLDEENICQFFDRILEAKPIKDTKAYAEGLWLKQSPTSDDIVSHFKRAVFSQTEESKRNVLVEMFKFCSDNLGDNTLLELHVAFLQRISRGLGDK